MQPIRYMLAVAVLVAMAGPVHAQTNGGGEATVLDDALVRFQAKRGLDLVYNMKYEQADKLFDQVDARFPEHPIGPFLHALNTWWKILLDFSDTSHDDDFFAAMDEVVKRADRMLKRDPKNFDAMFFKGAALGFRGRLRSNRRDWFKAASDGKGAMDYVLAVAEKDPSNPDYIFGKGLYDYYAAVVPDKYPFVKPVMHFFPKGDRELGLRELERTAKEGYYIRTEAAYFLLQIYYLFEEDFDKSVEYATWLRKEHPSNSFFHAIEGRIYAKWGDWARSEAIFAEILERYKQGTPGYNDATAEQALYYLARARMGRADYQPALDYLLKLEALSARTPADTYFKVLGRLRQGMVYDALGQEKVAQDRYRQVLAMKDWAGAHDRAERYLKRSGR